MEEIYRILKPGGVIAIIDLDSKRLIEGIDSNLFRKWAFEVTEPHISEYYKTNMTQLLEKADFKDIQTKINDPLNLVWLAKKVDDCLNNSCNLNKTENNNKQLMSI